MTGEPWGRQARDEPAYGDPPAGPREPMAAIGPAGSGRPRRGGDGEGDAEQQWGGRIGRRLHDLDAAARDAVRHARRNLAARTRGEAARRNLRIAAAILAFLAGWILAARRRG